MGVNEKILVKKENLQKIQTNLKVLRVMTNDKDALKTIDEMIYIINEELKEKYVSIKEKIKDRMEKTKNTDPELNFNLYMLYRKLSDGKIDEEEALKAYEIYTLL